MTMLMMAMMMMVMVMAMISFHLDKVGHAHSLPHRLPLANP